MNATLFDKYEIMGAYHWRECDRGSNQYNPPLAARYEAMVRRTPAGRVLDVGAGDGYLSGRIAPLCREVEAVEYEQAGVELARRMLAGHPNVRVQQGSGYHLPFEDASFDGIVMADVIEHLETPEIAVAEMARVLRDDGVALISTPHWRPDRVWDERHVQEFKAPELIQLLSHGFGQVELVFCWPRFWSNLYRTPLGWRGLRLLGRMGFNPFSKESASADGYYQIIAVCRQPKRDRR